MGNYLRVENAAGDLLGFIGKCKNGKFRSYIAIGSGLGPFHTVAEARQQIWAAYTVGGPI